MVQVPVRKNQRGKAFVDNYEHRIVERQKILIVLSGANIKLLLLYHPSDVSGAVLVKPSRK